MSYKIDKEIIKKTTSCNFAKNCLEDFDGGQCCEVLEGASKFLLINPTSTYKISHCSYCQEIKNNGNSIHICHCPIRIELYKKSGR
jgi:hypothetical protein